MNRRRLILSFVLTLIARASSADELEVSLYPAFASEGALAGAIVEGRVIELERRPEATADDGKRANLRRNLDLLSNDEIDEHEVAVRIGARAYEVETDEEGYFRVTLGDQDAAPAGWSTISAGTDDLAATGDFLVVPSVNVHGVISDLDDTILITEVTSKRRMLANTLFGNPMQRLAVPRAADAYRALLARNVQPDGAPMFYLSASPRQLHGAIQRFLDHNRFPRGVLITKRVTNDRTSEPWTDQRAYKLERIEHILTRTPHVRYTLIGDDGEHDPEIYDAVRRRWPSRIDAIWIRRVHPDPKRPRFADQGDMAALLQPRQ